jgi:DNA-binding IclR family transcriptional regulator
LRPVPAVSRAIAILRLLGRSAAPMTLKSISQELGMVTSTCLHILRVLVDEGLVKLDVATKRYGLGAGMLALARSVIESSPFPTLVQPVLDRLSGTWNVTAIGVEVTGVEHMVVMALSRSRAPFRLHVDVGSRFPALISATGRLVAAFTELPAPEIERRFKALRWEQPPDLDAWRREVDTVRRKGYSIDRGNYISGIAVIAVPIFDTRQRMTHSLVAAGVADQLGGSKSLALAKDLKDEAQALSQLLAARG